MSGNDLFIEDFPRPPYFDHQDYAPKIWILAPKLPYDARVTEAGSGHLTTLLGTAWLQYQLLMSSLLDVDKT